jgi:tetratricopeptide (TPR) repeat protein
LRAIGTVQKTIGSISLPILLLSFGTGCDVIEARGLAREGNEAYLAYDYRTAIDKYHQAMELDPETPNLYLNLGYAYFSIFDPTSDKEEERRAAIEAVEAFEKHLERHPEDDAARVFQIKTLIKAAPHDEQMADRALETFLEMLERNPDDHEARQYLITLFIDCRRYEDAVAFFRKELEAEPDDIETMKILAIIADKSERTQEAVDWYWRRAEHVDDPEKKASLYYEVGTYAWNLLHYQPDRVQGVAAIKLADQGIEACNKAMDLKDRYAEAMVYANLLYLKRARFEPSEEARSFDQVRAFELRKAAGKIMLERKKAAAAEAAEDAAEAAEDAAERVEEEAEAAEDAAEQAEEEAEAAEDAAERAE